MKKKKKEHVLALVLNNYPTLTREKWSEGRIMSLELPRFYLLSLFFGLGGGGSLRLACSLCFGEIAPQQVCTHHPLCPTSPIVAHLLLLPILLPPLPLPPPPVAVHHVHPTTPMSANPSLARTLTPVRRRTKRPIWAISSKGASW